MPHGRELCRKRPKTAAAAARFTESEQSWDDMKDIKVAVVDDSPFSVIMLSNILTESGFNVVGSAGTLEEAVEMVSQQKPDVVTMDMTMPGTDGLTVTRAIHVVDPNIKVIVVSSMMDEEIVHSAKKAKVSGYIQKPVDAEELTLIINRVMADEELFSELDKLYFTVFKEALNDTFNRMFKFAPTFRDEVRGNVERTSQGFSIVMGIIGKYGGRMILDMAPEEASEFTARLLHKEPASLKNEDFLSVMGEFSNIVAGIACSLMNKSNKLLGLRVAPPTIIHGESVVISKSDLDTVSSVKADSPFGELYMSVGFNRGECE